MPQSRRLAAALTLALAGVACAPRQAPSPVLAAAPVAVAAPALDRANLDTTCAACDNFFQFANGGWITRTQMPAAYGTWGSFNELSDRNNAVLRQIMQELARGVGSARPGSNEWKIGTYYASCMDTAAIERAGIAPVQPELDIVAGIHTRGDLGPALTRLEIVHGLAPYGFGAGVDARSSNDMLISAGQGGIGLPDRDFYTRTDDRSVALRRAYQDYVAKLFTLAGEPADSAAANAERVMRVETRFAAASMGRVQMRDPNATYHKMTYAEFKQLTPHYDWDAYLRERGVLDKAAFVNVAQPDWYREFDKMLQEVPLEDWRAYLRARSLSTSAPNLGAAFVNANFEYSRNFTGQRELLARERRCTSSTNGALGEAVGQEYVRRTFTPEARARALRMVDNLRAALRERIAGLTWMSDSTKTQALAKLDAFTRKIGYPDRWRDYSTLDVGNRPWASNVIASSQYSARDNWSRLGKPVDKTEWGMTPPTVNAYYNPLYNEIVFPAGILQPPFYDPNADDAINYGAMGAVIGHEMTHGFDDQGRQFDAAGNLRDWWTADDAAKYTAQADLVAAQFNGYTVVDSATHVNGRLTLGENIADLGGLTIAYAALQKELQAHGRPGPIDGFTPEQRFFLGWAQVWRELRRPEAARTQVQVDPHAPARWRVNGPLSNMPEFQAAWGCKAGDSMVRPTETRAHIW